MNNTKQIMVSRYDETIKEPPYLTIQVNAMLIDKPQDDQYGEIFCQRLREGCHLIGYRFKFYTLSEDTEFDYEVVVH
jgi:hypothetical protein